MLPDLDVDNVFVYIADDLREDFAPTEILNQGLRFKTVASGIHSPTSISSILSGTYLPQHRVGRFQDTLADDVPNFVNRTDVETGFANTMHTRLSPDATTDMISGTLGVDAGPVDRIDDIEPPFAFVERSVGAHAPYVNRGVETGTEYHENRASAPRHRFAGDYETGVEDDVEWFRSQVERLADRDLLDDTLVIYVSDHGEVLGENGMMTHGPPIHPAHVYVPTVFIHPDLPAGEEADGVLRHVDILPTLSGLFDWEWETPITPVGRDLTTEGTADRGFTFYEAVHSTPLGSKRFRMDSVWDRHGGYVFPRMDLLEQAMLAGYHFLNAPWAGYARRHPLEHLVFKFRGQRCHRAPTFSPDEAEDLIAEARGTTASEGADRDNDIPTEQLRQLGYIE